MSSAQEKNFTEKAISKNFIRKEISQLIEQFNNNYKIIRFSIYGANFFLVLCHFTDNGKKISIHIWQLLCRFKNKDSKCIFRINCQ